MLILFFPARLGHPGPVLLLVSDPAIAHRLCHHKSRQQYIEIEQVSFTFLCKVFPLRFLEPSAHQGRSCEVTLGTDGTPKVIPKKVKSKKVKKGMRRACGVRCRSCRVSIIQTLCIPYPSHYPLPPYLCSLFWVHVVVILSPTHVLFSVG